MSVSTIVMIAVIFAIILGFINLFIMIIMFRGLRLLLTDILKRELRTLGLIEKIKMVIKFEEGIDLSEPLPYSVEVDDGNNKSGTNEHSVPSSKS